MLERTHVESSLYMVTLGSSEFMDFLAFGDRLLRKRVPPDNVIVSSMVRHTAF